MQNRTLSTLIFICLMAFLVACGGAAAPVAQEAVEGVVEVTEAEYEDEEASDASDNYSVTSVAKVEQQSADDYADAVEEEAMQEEVAEAAEYEVEEAMQEEVVEAAEYEVEEALEEAAEIALAPAVAEAAADAYHPQPTPRPRATTVPSAPDSFFEDYGVNPMIDAEDDNLSTFAIDVDTGAYSIMRQYLDNGAFPPTDSVRPEEYINYFDQGYEVPTEGAFAIHLDAAPSPYAESDRYQLVRVGIQGYEVPDSERPDALLIFVIDVSGSMAGYERLGLVKDSLIELVAELNRTDRVGIVVYGSRARVVLEPTYVRERSNIIRAINGLQTEGATNAEEGLRIAYRMADAYYDRDQINRLILASDGVANVGATTAEEILEYAERGISLSSFGFGMGNYNDVFMEQLANQGDGTYAYVDTIEEARRLFIDDLTGTLLTIAKDAKVQVEFDPETVRSYRLIGYENRDVADEDFRNDSVDAGEIGAGHSVTALYEVKFFDEDETGDDVLTVRLRYENPETGDVEEISETLSRQDVHRTFGDAPATFQLTALVAEYAEILRDSYWARDNDLGVLAIDARRIERLLDDNVEGLEFLEIVDNAAYYAGY